MLASVTPVQHPPLDSVMRASTIRSTASKAARSTRWLRWKRPTRRKRGGCAPCSPRSASTPASTSSPRPAGRSSRTGSPPMQHVREAGLSHQRREGPGRAPQHRGRRDAAAPAGAGRDRHDVELRRAHRPVPVAPRDAHRHRLPRRYRRGDPRHRRRQGGIGRLERRLRPHGRGRPRQRPRDALRPPVGNRRAGRPDASRPARSSAASARPDAQPGRICTTRPASTAKRSTRRSSCTPAPSSG